MKHIFILLACTTFLLSACFSNKGVESSEHISMDSISHYYSIQLNEKDSVVEINFAIWPLKDRDKRFSIPSRHALKINNQNLTLDKSSYKRNIPLSQLPGDIITLTYMIEDTVFYSKRIQLARFKNCTVVFNATDADQIGIFFEPALNSRPLKKS